MRSGSEVFPVADADERPALRYDVQGAAAGDGLATGVNSHVDYPRSPIAHDGHQIRLPQVDRPPSQLLGQGQVIGRDIGHEDRHIGPKQQRRQGDHAQADRSRPFRGRLAIVP